MDKASDAKIKIPFKEKKKKKKHLSKFALLRCLELYFKDDHDQALILTDFIWEKKDQISN